jgi:hypothetical protein
MLTARRERRFLRLALAAEIGALVKHFERRWYLEDFEASAKFFQTLPEEKLSNPFTPPKPRFDFFDVYSANVGRVGLMGERAADVVKFYVSAKGLQQAVKLLETIPGNPNMKNPKDVGIFFGDLAMLTRELMTEGKALEANLLNDAESDWDARGVTRLKRLFS